MSEQAFVAGQSSVDIARLSSSGNYQNRSEMDAYVSHLLGYVSLKNLKGLKLVVNAGNGAAGPALDAVETGL